MLDLASRHISVSIICDIPVNIQGLISICESMSIGVREIRNSILFFSELSGSIKSDAIIIDLNIANPYMVLEVTLKNKRKNDKVIVFSEGVWVNKENITFIHRRECVNLMKSYLSMGVLGGYGISPKLTSTHEFTMTNISIIESFVLKEWFLGASLSDISQMCNKSTKTISSHKRNAMKKLMVSNNRELYHALKSLYLCIM